jgi:hypothetical protein
VTSLLDVDLEEVPQIVLARAREAQLTLLLDRCGLGVALRDDDAAKVSAIFAGTSCQAFSPLWSPK